MQNELKWLGLYSGEIDGSYGPATKKAVENYQSIMGLKVDGITGNNTWKSLGLVYRTQSDVNAGVQIITVGLKQYSVRPGEGNIYGIYYTTTWVTSYMMQDKGYVEGKDYIMLDFASIAATNQYAAETMKVLEKAAIDEATSVVMGSLKVDIKQVESVAKYLKMSAKQTELFKREIEYLKRSVGKRNNDNFSYSILVEIGKEIIQNFK